MDRLRDCPSLRAGLAILRRDTIARPNHRSSGRERRARPIQCTGRPMRSADPKSHKNGSVSNVGDPDPRPTGSNDRSSGASSPAGTASGGPLLPPRATPDGEPDGLVFGPSGSECAGITASSARKQRHGGSEKRLTISRQWTSARARSSEPRASRPGSTEPMPSAFRPRRRRRRSPWPTCSPSRLERN